MFTFYSLLFVAFLPCSVLATATPLSIEDYTKLLDRRDGTLNGMSWSDLDNIKFYAQHCAAAYCNYKAVPGTNVTCDKNACPRVEANKVIIVGSMAGDTTGLGAYVSLDTTRQEIVLSIRGSDSLRNFVTDIIFWWHDCHFTDHCKVHAGFSKGWREIRDEAVEAINSARGRYPNFRVIVTGHSLGGAGAVLAAADLVQDGIPFDIYTYGCPRVGNDHFSDWLTGQPGAKFRVTHDSDPIPRLPPIEFGYRHISPEYWITNGADGPDEPEVDVQVCDGIKNTHCNGGTWHLDFAAHLRYFGETSACLGNPLKWKRSDGLSAEVKQRLMDWSQKDREFAQSSE
ncbi:hypothetical protein E4U55_000477 [Claviceps digitariae]|nr:hypothetical protein E4U55_000477 [Claviceps digitariae]